jgi:uncharacterized membrane protein
MPLSRLLIQPPEPDRFRGIQYGLPSGDDEFGNLNDHSCFHHQCPLEGVDGEQFNKIKMMTRVEKSILIPAPLKEVFQYASDYRKWPEWFKGVSDFKPITEIDRGNGARYVYKAAMMGMKVTVETEIQDYVEYRGWIGIAKRGMPHKTFWNFEPEDGGTRFTYALEYRLPIPLLGSLLDSFVLKGRWEKIIDQSLKNLKEKCLQIESRN